MLIDYAMACLLAIQMLLLYFYSYTTSFVSCNVRALLPFLI